MAVWRASICGLLVVSAYASPILLSGTAEMGGSVFTPSTGLTLQITGAGVLISANLSNAEGFFGGFIQDSPGEILADNWTYNEGMGFAYGSATIGQVSSLNYTLTMSEMGTTGDFVGSLTLCPNSSLTCGSSDPVIASASVEMFLASKTIVSNSGYYNNYYVFSTTDPPPVINTSNAPEPALWPVILGVVLILARKSH